MSPGLPCAGVATQGSDLRRLLELARAGSRVLCGRRAGSRDAVGDEVPKFGTQAAVANFRAGVVIATSGMMNQGPVVSWARKVLTDPASSVLVVGYQDEESPGRRLLALAEAGGGRFELPGRDHAEGR